MSDSSLENIVKFTDTTVIKQSPSGFIDFSIELEYDVLTHLKQCGVIRTPKVINYKFGVFSFIEMERLTGCVLSQHLKTTTSKKEVYFLLINLLYALAELHEHGVSHGDVHGENIILLETESPENIWTIHGQEYRVPSNGKVPVFIDFGLSHLQTSRFKSDLSIAYSGVITSCCADYTTDVLKLIATMGTHKDLRKYLDLFIEPQDKNYLCIDDELSNSLKNLLQTQPWQYKFFTAELFNVLRCLPPEEIKNNDHFDETLNVFLTFLVKTAKRTSPFKFFVRLKRWYFKQKYTVELSAGSSIINYFLKSIIPEAIKVIQTRRDNLKYPTTALEAINIFKESIGRDLN